MPIDLERARRDTPGCAHVVHFNNAGAALMPQPVVDALRDHLDAEARDGGYEAAEAARKPLRDTYAALAELVGGDPSEIAVVENATRAWDAAFYAFDFREGDRIVTAESDYASNAIAMLQVARRTGAHIDVAPSDGSGQVDVAALERLLTPRTRLIALTHVPTNGGLVNPAEDVGRVAREHGIPYLLDACQSAGQMPLDVERIGCDLLSATGRKFLRGPRGTGFLWARRSLIGALEPPMIDLHAAVWTAPDRYQLHDDARRFETWEGFVAGKLALGVAVRYALGFGLQAIGDRVGGLAESLRERLGALPRITVHDLGVRRCGIVTFSVEGTEAQRLKMRLRAARMNVSVAVPSSARYDAARRSLPDMVRASVHYYNSEEEVDRFVREVARLTA